MSFEFAEHKYKYMWKQGKISLICITIDERIHLCEFTKISRQQKN